MDNSCSLRITLNHATKETKMRLTDLQIRKLRAPKSGQKTFFDSTLPGFGVRVSQGGAKSFVVMYGERRRLKTLGRYPDLPLADARREAKKIQSDLPLVSGQVQSVTSLVSFDEARNNFLLDSKRRNKVSTYQEYVRLLSRYFHFDQKLQTVTRHQIMNAVGAVRSQSESQHAFVAIRTLMNWCIRNGLIDHSPVPPMRFKIRSRSRILNDGELKEVWDRAIEIGYPYGDIVRMLVLTGQRRGEIANLRRSWLDKDLIVFPAHITKNGREHRLPLTPGTAKLIAEIDHQHDLLFPSRYDPDKPLNGWPKCKRELDIGLQVTGFTLHDLRRTYASSLARLGTPIHVTERILNHASGIVSGVAAVYNRYSYMDEMRDACHRYEKWLASLCS